MTNHSLYAFSEATVDAVEKLKAYNATPLKDRAKAAEQIADEHAGELAIPGNLQGGVVTLQQAEAKFIDLNVRAYSDISDMFTQTMPLAFGEQPIFKTRVDHAIRINIGHLAGGPPAVKFATAQTGTPVTPFQYFSEEFLVPNLVNTSFNLDKFHEKEQALARVAYEMKLKKQQYRLNTMFVQPLGTPIATSIVSYYGTTPFTGRTPYVLDQQVDPNSIATTNIINATAEGGMTKNFFMAIASQMILQKHEARSLYLPISGKPWESWWQQAAIVALASSSGNQDVRKAIPPSKWEEAVSMSFSENGNAISIFGLNIWCQPTNILPAGYTLIGTNEAPILEWDQFSESVSDEDPLGGAKRGLSKRYEARSIALASPDPGLLAFSVARYV